VCVFLATREEKERERTTIQGDLKQWSIQGLKRECDSLIQQFIMNSIIEKYTRNERTERKKNYLIPFRSSSLSN
jgi:hypothetical protein